MGKLAAAFRPNKASAGYALFLAINATAVWGGVFPFLPLEIQTAHVMFWFFFAEALVFAAAFLASIVGAYFLPNRTKRFLVIVAATPYLLGWACLIAAIYVDGAALALATAGGALLGLGSAGFYMLWQRLFAGTEPGQGTHDLIVGTALASLIYFALYLIPRAVTAFLVPLVFLPLFALAAVLCSRKVDLNQPMFEDIPREHPQVYRRVLSDVWRSALCMGGLGMCTGIMRAAAITDPAAGSIVNIISMGSSFVAAVVLVVLWSRHSIRINVINAYRVVFPIVLTMFLVMPFIPTHSIRWLAGASYALNSVGILFMMIQCAQISRDRGINPVFIYGFFGGIMYALHDLGFIAGTLASGAIVAGLSSTALAALIAVYVLSILFLIGQKRGDERAAQFSDGNSIELVANIGDAVAGAAETPSTDASSSAAPEDNRTADPGASEGETATPPDSLASAETEAPIANTEPSAAYTDRISKQVHLMKEDFGLSTREAEVAELLARGQTVARIAELLFVSENTVRTHSKRIYAKLDVHKKQQLRDLVDSYDPSAVE